MNDKSNPKLEDFFKRLRSLCGFSTSSIMTVNSRDASGDTPLHIASIWGDIDAIETLLAAGADINARGDMNCTPLHYAVSQNKVEAAKSLIKHGALLDIKDEISGWTPVDKARLSENEEIKNLFKVSGKNGQAE